MDKTTLACREVMKMTWQMPGWLIERISKYAEFRNCYGSRTRILSVVAPQVLHQPFLNKVVPTLCAIFRFRF